MVNTAPTSAGAVAARVIDPELPMLTLADLGVLRAVETDDEGRVLVTITPTYTGCPAIEVMRADLRDALEGAGYEDVRIETALSPAWSSDWISPAGRRKLSEAGIAPPGSSPRQGAGPIPLSLEPPSRTVTCPRCGSQRTNEVSAFSATACKSLRSCRDCGEPFEHFKEI